MKTVVPLAVLSAAKYIEQYGQSAVMLLTAPDALCTYEIPAAKVLAEWVLENCGPEDEAEPDAESPFTPGIIHIVRDRTGITVAAAWDRIATLVIPREPTRFFHSEASLIVPTDSPVHRYRHQLSYMLAHVRGDLCHDFKADRSPYYAECRVYSDVGVYILSAPGIVVFIP
jgi:hypothetical protein